MNRILILYGTTVKMRIINSDTIVIFSKPKKTCYRHPPRRASDSQICTALYMAIASNMFPIAVQRTLDCIVCLHCKFHESRTRCSYSLNFQCISLCLSYMRYPVKYSVIFFSFPNYVEVMASFLLRISIDRIIAHVIYFYREFTSLP